MAAPLNDTIGRLAYVEFSVPGIGKAKAFYQEAFGWALVDFGPTYAASVSGDVDIGLQADNPGGTKPPLPIIQVGKSGSLTRTNIGGRSGSRSTNILISWRNAFPCSGSQRKRDHCDAAR